MALFVFDIVVMNAYVIATLCAAVCYAFSKKRLFLYAAILAACFLIDHFIIFAAQFLFNSFSSVPVETELVTAPAMKIVFFVARQAAYLLVAKELFGLEYPRWTYGVFALLFVLYWNIYSQISSPDDLLATAAFYTVMQVYLLALVVVCLRRGHLDGHAHLRRLLLATIVMLALIVAYDAIWTFRLYNPFDAIFGFANESNPFETLMHANFSCLIIRSAIQWIGEQTKANAPKAAGFDDASVEGAIASLGLTRREAEVFRLLVEDYSYQEICDKLVVSMSTVKSHAHNIYDKAGCSRRSDLRRLVSSALDPR